jgi:transcriptional regulator with XRE-family HTH domain
MDQEASEPRKKFRGEAEAAFAANLKRLRTKTGLSQENLSYRASLSRPHVGLIENCEMLPELDTVWRLAGALGVDPGELLTGLHWRPDESVERGHGTEEPPDKWDDGG